MKNSTTSFDELVPPQSKQPIPKDAKSVFKGKIFEVYQWQQEQYDGTFTTFEKVKRPDTVSIIPVTKDKKIILTKQLQPSILEPFYSPVGGVVDPGEAVTAAAHRELQEETGYTSDDVSLWYSFQASFKVEWSLYIFVAHNCYKTSEQHLDSGEKIEPIFVDFDEFFKIATGNNFRDKELSLRLLREHYHDPRMVETRRVLGLI